MKSLRAFEIVEYIEKHKFCSLAELMEKFHVSQATIHRDVSALVRDGRIRKVHGGVASLSSAQALQAPGKDIMPSHYRERMNIDMPAKEAIARKALREINDGDIIFLDSSTTVYYLAHMLQKSSFANLTLITNSVLIIQEFTNFPANYFLVALGGNFDLQLNAFLGQAAMRELEHLQIDKSFISGVGITESGVFSRQENHTFFLHRMLELSRTNYLLLNGSKFGKGGLYSIAPLEMFDKVISEQRLPDYAEAVCIRKRDR